MTLPRVVGLGFILGVTFSAWAAIADALIQRQLPHHPVFYDPADFLASLVTLERPTF